MTIGRKLLTEFQHHLERDRLYRKLPRRESPHASSADRVRVMSWNIGRGYHPDRIADAIGTVRPDIVCLQEVDWNNDRTGRCDVLQHLAERTNMFGVFGIEFLELQAPGRTRRSAGGGAIGNALLCRTPPVTTFRIELPSVLDWEHGAENGRLPEKVRRSLRRERRIGSRFGLAAEFAFRGSRLLVCSAHFEDKFGGVSGRFQQYQSVLQAMDRRSRTDTTIIVAGDFNTFDSRLARLVVPDTDVTALGRPDGVTEAEWWKRRLLPPTGFVDPFAADAWTFQIAAVFRAKLDWITLKNGVVRNCGIGPFASSDHRPIWADIEAGTAQDDGSSVDGASARRGSGGAPGRPTPAMATETAADATGSCQATSPAPPNPSAGRQGLHR
jgi:endonuclease/exonuclease/phosphatase family metal-dependent hydrolase